MRDVGEYIPYAKKENFAGKENFKGEITLKQLWPEPDWNELYQRGINAKTCAKMYVYYHNLRKKPYNEYISTISPLQWAQSYKRVIEWMKSGYEKIGSAEDLAIFKESFREAMGLPVHDSTRTFDDDYVIYAAGRGEGRTVRTPFSMNLRARHLSETLPELGWPTDVKANQVKLFPVEFESDDPNTELWFLCKVQGKKYTWKNSKENNFKSRQEAIDKLKEILCNGSQLITPKKDLSELKDYTDKKNNINAEELIKTFGVRGVQFGNALSEIECQKFVSNTYLALKYLASILNIPENWIGLGGIGLAFGARGVGKANAHFENELNVINLTRTSGAGSIAHEWFHALDARLARSTDFPFDLLSKSFYRWHLSSGDFRHNRRITAFKNIYDAVCDTDTEYYERSYNIQSQKRAKKYWTEPEELLARAFESYIEDKCTNMPTKTDWLAYGTQPIEDYEHKDYFPYPTSLERARFNSIFEENMKVIWEK